jgi:farnesyl diphosphate synthase
MLHNADLGWQLGPSLERIGREIDALFDEVLAGDDDVRGRLRDAMRHAAVGGGKRLRPLLVVGSGALFGVPRSLALRAGLAVEALHVHSLIHDDLPCMDDDDLRRGKPTVHRAYDEATAVLAGDALHALAFELLADRHTHPDAAVRAELVMELARAAGASGMAQGQMLDMLGGVDDLAQVTRLQRLKTGALIDWCTRAGAIMGYASPEARASLAGYALCLGLAFQIADDLLDVEGDAGSVGKRVGKDADKGKQNFVTVLGARHARAHAEMLVEQGIDHLKSFDEDAQLLCDIARYAIARDR